jgi:hypothetical protein
MEYIIINYYINELNKLFVISQLCCNLIGKYKIVVKM